MNIPSTRAFREYVDTIENKKVADTIKTLYLLAARPIEICTKSCPADIERGLKPYGQYIDCSLGDWKYRDSKGEDKTEKVLLVKSAVAKRKLKRKAKEGEANVVFKMVALPTSYAIEPWSYDLCLRIEKYGTLALDRTRHTLWQRCRDALSPLEPSVNAKSLRHWRITSLVKDYSMTPYQLVAFTGWSFSYGVGSMTGQPVGQLQTYLHLSWQTYFQNLMRSLSEVYGYSAMQSPPQRAWSLRSAR